MLTFLFVKIVILIVRSPHTAQQRLVNICFSVKFTFRCCLDVLKHNLFNVVNSFKNISVVAPALLLLSAAFNANT